MTVVRVLVGLIQAMLRVAADMLTSGIGLLVAALTLVLVVAALGASGVTGFEASRVFRKGRNKGGSDRNGGA